ncbi:hypothetical protein ACFO4N_06205 [Camelliibacillus cellulosilyticus]|uniref:Uncharacterized protein n=1 Tax=Camelliibacillus cellulosilyticus TaxID=2174486 RepID=A0ABV9GJ57_9BACL
MKVIGTIVNKSGHPIGIFQVKPHVVEDKTAAESFRKELRTVFAQLPLVLISQIDGKIIYEGAERDVRLIKQDNPALYGWRGYEI